MRFLAVALAAAFAVAPALAQQRGGAPTVGIPTSAVVVLDRDALFSESLFGQRIARDIDAASAELASENRQIEAELEAEERRLTQQRDTMGISEFRELASEFDSRVTDIRQTQDAKARAISQQTERAQQIFLEKANPILVQLARETGALVILDRRIVIASADQVDITALALTRIDAALGDGGSLLDDTPPTTPQEPDAPTGD
ncbi:periplasmic chaperone for outer membrane proteins Skp [Jannaschia faecimaris]|uniref:Periplasmic chaperone for outer membrane proteins Skp n=1 Tax=Jannaschia faecimaris TaxID=1244108 RepID=A0A1H3SCR6_9RHOB|nr:OmpH family outer membrane protein [Jannaschia faecimaris]SDZ34899.1 periplasmic chaperone for outer membrane proteins Skp [Jannaschia faecimaris]